MKIGGKKIDCKPASEMIVFPRESGDIALRANAVLDQEPFEKLCPLPKPPMKRVKGGKMVEDYDNPRFAKMVNQHSTKFIDWLIITSLCGVNKETKEDVPIEWETVDRSDQSTWHNWDDELRASGFSDMERKRVNGLVVTVNSLSERRLDEARESFLQPMEEVQDDSSSQTTEQNDTLSGEPVNGSVSDHPVSRKAGTTSTK